MSKLPTSIPSAPSSTALASSDGTTDDTKIGISVIERTSRIISSLAQISTALAPDFSAEDTTFLIFSISKLSIPAITFTALFSSK